MVVIEIPKDEKTEELLDSLVEHLAELKSELGEVRRQGMDASMVELLMMDFMPKVKLARTTYEQKDIDAVKKALAQIRHEIDLVKAGTDFDAALDKIQAAYDNIRAGKLSEARDIYIELRGVYSKLSGELRRIVYTASIDIHKRLEQASAQ
jgi:hypothetical protein